MSNSLLEAMATVLPCVVSGIGGNADLVSDRANGRLVADATPDAWAAALIELLQDDETARRLGTAARQRIDQEYSISKVVDRYIEIYRQMIEGHWPRD